MDVTRRLKTIENSVALARFNAHPISYPRSQYDRFLAQARSEGVSLEPWQKRVAAVAAKLGQPAPF